MFCPKCAAQTVQGQRFCRNCGTNIGVIVDAIDGKQQRGPVDFESLKNDLRELGSNLRVGFDQFRGTHRLDKQGAAPTQPAPMPPGVAEMAQELRKAVKRDIEKQVSRGLRKTRIAHSRMYSLQKAALSLFGGGAMLFAWRYLLQHSPKLIRSIEDVVFQQTGAQIEGIDQVISVLWVLAFIPIASGVAHLINGIFFAPKREELMAEEPAFQEQPGYVYSMPYPAPVSAVPPASHIANNTTNELNQATVAAVAQPSVTEDATLRFEEARPQP